MTTIKSIIIPAVFLICLLGCKKPPRNYYADQDDPGLSRLTSYGYNIATNYINGVAYINPYVNPSYFGTGGGDVVPTFNKIIGNSTTDTLALSWPIEVNINGQYGIPDSYIDLLIVVPKNFTEGDFVAWRGKRFADTTNRISMSSGYYYTNNYSGLHPDYSDSSLHGVANIYFVDIVPSADGLFMTGLFNGTIGNDISITNGRFDFNLPNNLVSF